MKTLIRAYRPGDFISLQSLWEQTGMGQAERGDSEEVIQRCNALGGELLVLVNRDSDEIIGSSWMTWDGRRMFLHHFAILPAYQKKGFGTMLAKESMKRIREKGVQAKLEVHKQNRAAKRLYKKFGFRSFKDYEILMIQDTSNDRE
jgi:ribosomal protein S18 acetylase RimI-like enzyme